MTEKMNLTWRKCQTGNHIAILPNIPGYPIDDSFQAFSHMVTLVRPGWDTKNVTDKWTFEMSLTLRKGVEATLTNDDFNIPGTATVEEMKQAVENLTVEEIAAKFQEKDYQPDNDTTAGRNLDWKRNEYGSYIAQLPAIPGYQETFSANVYHHLGISAVGDWHLDFNNRPNPTVFLYDIPGIVMHAKTPEQLMRIAEEQFTPEKVANLLAEKGYKQVAE